MNNPIIAIFWLSYRMSRGWHLFFTTFLLLTGFFAIRTVPAPPQVGAFGAFIFSYIIASIASFCVISMNQKDGFPFKYQFRQPISTVKLVVVSMLSQALIVASIFCIPLLALSIVYDVSFEYLPASVLIIVMSLILLYSSWAPVSSGLRAFNFFLAFVLISIMLGYIDPYHFETSRPAGAPPPELNGIILTIGDYFLLLMVSLLCIADTVYSVSRQRCGEKGRFSFSLSKTETNTTEKNKAEKLPMTDRIRNLFFLACPTGSPWKAELWAEMKRYGFPVLVLSLILAALVPPVFYARGEWGWKLSIEYALPEIIFLVGIGMSIFNRRLDKGGYMNAFERARPMSTVQLMSIHLLTIGLSTAIGIEIISGVIWLSAPLLQLDSINSNTFLAIYNSILTLPALDMIASSISGLMLFLCTTALFLVLHACSIFWKRWFSYTILIIAVFAIVLLFQILTGQLDINKIENVIQFSSAILFGIFALSIARTFQLKLISMKAFVFAIEIWGIFLLCILKGSGIISIDLSNMNNTMLLLTCSALCLPLTLFFTSTWCYDKLRHY